jgi:hypothetical protein
MSTVRTHILPTLQKGNGAGRIKTDASGNRVWEWDTESEEEIEQTSVMLSKLNHDDLSLEDDKPAPTIEKTGSKLSVAIEDEGGGMNPYASSSGINPKDSVDPKKDK